jgi:hypothetical protein
MQEFLTKGMGEGLKQTLLASDIDGWMKDIIRPLEDMDFQSMMNLGTELITVKDALTDIGRATGKSELPKWVSDLTGSLAKVEGGATIERVKATVSALNVGSQYIREFGGAYGADSDELPAWMQGRMNEITGVGATDADAAAASDAISGVYALVSQLPPALNLGADAFNDLIRQAGGSATVVSGFVDMLTDQEKTQMATVQVQRQYDAALKKSGMSSAEAAAGVRAYIKAQDTATEAGRKNVLNALEFAKAERAMGEMRLQNLGINQEAISNFFSQLVDKNSALNTATEGEFGSKPNAAKEMVKSVFDPMQQALDDSFGTATLNLLKNFSQGKMSADQYNAALARNAQAHATGTAEINKMREGSLGFAQSTVETVRNAKAAEGGLAGMNTSLDGLITGVGFTQDALTTSTDALTTAAGTTGTQLTDAATTLQAAGTAADASSSQISDAAGANNDLASASGNAGSGVAGLSGALGGLAGAAGNAAGAAGSAASALASIPSVVPVEVVVTVRYIEPEPEPNKPSSTSTSSTSTSSSAPPSSAQTPSEQLAAQAGPIQSASSSAPPMLEGSMQSLSDAVTGVIEPLARMGRSAIMAAEAAESFQPPKLENAVEGISEAVEESVDYSKMSTSDIIKG